MANQDKKIPISGVNLDTSPARLTPDAATFVKNLTYDVNKNNNETSGEGANLGLLTPLEANKLITNITFPAGDKLVIGTHECKENNKLYVCVYNNSGNHFIYNINGDTGLSTLVLVDSDLNFQNKPEYFISEGRMVVRVVEYIDPVTGNLVTRTFILLTDNFNDQRFICEEDSILTSFFTVPSNYFSIPNPYDFERRYLINLGVPPLNRCVSATPLAVSEEDATLQNLMNNIGWQWRLKYIDRYGRPSEHGPISDMYFASIGSNCIQSSGSVSRCVQLKIDLGGPFVEKIQIEFRKCSGDWFLYETIDKYDNTTNAVWNLRNLNTGYSYNISDNTFDYVFCGDKQCSPIDQTETSRNYNPLPLLSSSLFAINKGIGLANNVDGFEPVKTSELDKITFSVNPPVTNNCAIIRKITIYVPIYQRRDDTVVAISLVLPNPVTGENGVQWGNYGSTIKDRKPSPYVQPAEYGQYFPSGNQGFIGYLAGTDYRSISKQVSIDFAANQETAIGPLNESYINAWQGRDAFSKTPIVQKFEFHVAPGRYSFRIASSYASATEEYQKTSTSVAGVTSLGNIGPLINGEKELIIDCNGGDVSITNSTDNSLVIWDVAWGRHIEGYLREDLTSNIPVELANVYAPPASSGFGYSTVTGFTDHNGYYFISIVGNDVAISVEEDRCSAGVFTQKITTDNIWHTENMYVASPALELNPLDRRVITGRVELCGLGTAIGGALVVVKNGPFAYTDANGNFKLVLHQRRTPYADPGDYIFLSQKGSCQINDCIDDCKGIFNPFTIPYAACAQPGRDVVVPTWQAKIKGLNYKGLQNGSRRKAAVVFHDWMGRQDFAQSTENYFFDLPPLIDLKAFGFSIVSWAINNSFRAPSWAKFMSFWITPDLNNDDYLTWAVDKVEFVDSSGNINNITPAKIRIYYESLAEYNKQNSFGTNTTWTFTGVDANSTRIGDYIEFIRNGEPSTNTDANGWFNKTIKSLVTYDTQGKYIDIEYIAELADLVAGAYVKLIHPKICTTQYIFSELCGMIRINSQGIPEALSGTLNAYDSYYVNRSIPVPVENKDLKGDIIRSVISTNYSYFFEHRSPSDFWGDHCANGGRINVQNPYEKQTRSGSEIALSKSLVNKSSFNGMGYFTDGDKTTFEEQQWGNITTVVPEVNSILVICAHDSFVVGFNDNNIRIDASGNATAASLPNTFGKPQRKIGGNFGCQSIDINSVRKKNGFVIFVDRNRCAVVMHNYSDAKDVSTNAGYSGYLMAKIGKMNELQQGSAGGRYYYFVAGVMDDQYFLTSFSNLHNNMPANSYINNSIRVQIDLPETMCIDIPTGQLKYFASFTPEYYGLLEGFYKLKTMFSFKSGSGWSHKNNDTTVFNNFYGTQCKKVIQVVSNRDPDVEKRFAWNEVFCKEHKFVVDRIETESGQVSRILGANWDQRDKVWCSDFKCDINTPLDPNLPILAIAAIVEGNFLYGLWAKIRYISEDADDNKYCGLNSISIYSFNNNSNK